MVEIKHSAALRRPHFTFHSEVGSSHETPVLFADPRRDPTLELAGVVRCGLSDVEVEAHVPNVVGMLHIPVSRIARHRPVVACSFWQNKIGQSNPKYK